jgi:hypothetical protein
VSGEQVFGTIHAGIGIQRDTAEEMQDRTPAMATDLIPETIAQQGSDDSQNEGQGQVHSASAGQCPGSEQQGGSRDGQTQLLSENPKKQYKIPVLNQKLGHLIHFLLPPFPRSR